jgi:hypothetical protein
MSDVEFSDKIKKIHLLNLAIVSKVIEQLANIRRARYKSLHHPAKRLKDGGVIDRREVKLNFFYIDVILPYFFLQLYLILIAGVMLRKVDVRLVDKDEHIAVIGVFSLEVFVDIVEGIPRLVQVRRRTQDVD